MDRYKGHMVPRKVFKTSLDKRAKLARGALKNAEKSGKIVVDEDGNTVAEDVHIPLPFTDPAMADTAATAEEKGEGVEQSVGLKNGNERKRRERGTSFLPLKDVLPPLPKRGTFDVNEIKRSLYFFS
jgi:DNA-directed RNA polymerase